MQKPIIPILLIIAALLSVSASAQTKLTPGNAASRADICAPIGRTANGELVYSMKCDSIPVPQTRIEETAPPPASPPQQETQRSGIFGWSYDHRQTDQ